MSMTRDVRPPDLEMQVRTKSEHGRTWLEYTLDSPNGAVGFSRYTVAGPTVHGNPDDFHRYLLNKVEQLGDRLDVDGSLLLDHGIDRKLVNFGRALWRELIPPELRSAYREIRRSVRSWMIISDEPWIPWELIKPYDDSRPGDVLDDDFLSLRFELTRWLAGTSTPAREIAVRSFAALETADLPQAKDERILLEDLQRSSPGLAGKAPACDSAGELLGYLETCDAQLLHFMGHGTHESSQADEAGIPLPDGSALRPLDLEGPVATQIRRNQPLVVMNTCWAARQGWSLTRLGGWASRWVEICGCSAFVAPMWPIRDQIALSFARAFYDALAGGSPLGEAALEARRQIYRERSGDPSVLAYAVYGHPHTRVRFGVDSSAEETVPVAETRGGRPIQWRRRKRWRSWWIWAAAAVILLFLTATAGWIRDSWNLREVPSQSSSLAPSKPGPVEPRKEQAAEPVQTAEREPDQKTTPTPVSPAGKKTQSTVAVIDAMSTDGPGGIDFEITAASGVPKSKLKNDLWNVAAPLAGMGISGWTLHLDVEPPRITSHTRDGSSSETCRLVARCNARRQGTSASLDLGTVSVVNAQDDGVLACEEAAQALAKDVVYRFVSSIRKGEI